jgi:hypothetical protein
MLLNTLRRITYYLKKHISLHELRYFYSMEIFLFSAYVRSVFKSKVIYHKMGS